MIEVRLHGAFFFCSSLIRDFDQCIESFLGFSHKSSYFIKHFFLYRRICSCCRHCIDSVGKCLCIFDERRHKLFACHVDHRARLDIDRFRICLVLDLRTGFQLGFCEHTESLEEIYRCICHHSRNCLYHGADVRQASFLSLLYPRFRITVAIEDDSLVLCCIFLDQIMYRQIKVICFLKYIACIRERLCNDRIEHNVRRSNGITGSDHTELEFVSCKRER